MNKLGVIHSSDLVLNTEDEKYYFNGETYSGFADRLSDNKVLVHYQILKGVLRGSYIEYETSGNLKLIGTYNDVRNGYFIELYPYGCLFTVFDMEAIIEIIKVDNFGKRIEYYNIESNYELVESWKMNRAYNKDNVDYDVIPYYKIQNKLRTKVIKDNKLPKDIKYVAGVDVAYNELEQRMVGAMVVLDASTLEIVEESSHEMKITFPYIPGLFSFREIPPLLEVYRKLEIKPDLIVCDGQGIAHPKGVGMATHLGIELDIPTIGCAKKRLVGAYDKKLLKNKRGSKQSLIWDDQEVGVALRTQNGVNPVFVSIGHKIDLDTAIECVLKLCSKYRLPETTRLADQYVNTLMKERTEYDIFGDNNEPIHPA